MLWRVEWHYSPAASCFVVDRGCMLRASTLLKRVEAKGDE
jgi:hypothetical protein